MAYTSTQRFVKITDYLLLEYNYTTAPTPEIYFVNTGFPAVGFEKIVNGYFDNTVQILNSPDSEGTTHNVRDLSVVQVDKNRFVTLDKDFLVPYLDTDPKLTSVSNLPVVFPSNIGVYYDSVKFHIVSGYNFDNLDGVILQAKFQERTGKKATVMQVLLQKADVELPVLNPNPIYLGGALYDKYVEVKFPAYANMVYEFDVLNGNSAQSSTLAAKISSDGNGFLRDAPVEFTVFEVTQTVLKNGYQNYIGQTRAQLSIFPKDNFSSLSGVIQENQFYNYLEFYPTWDGNFLEDFLSSEGKVGNTYYVVNDIEVKEQVGLSYITTYNFTSVQTEDFNSPAIFRPVLVNPLSTSFVVNYTMRLVNKGNQNQIIRRSTFSSFDVNKYGKENNIINLTTGAYAQKVYNKIIQAPNLISNVGVAPNVTPLEKKIPVFYKDNNISVTQETIIIDKNGNIISETSTPDVTRLFGQGKAKVLIDPFDNFFKFTVYNLKDGTTPELLDLGNSLTYYMVFLDVSGQSVRVENIKNKTAISNPSQGQISFKVVDSNSKKILGFTTKEFYIVSKTPDGVETKLYSGSWQNQTEFLANSNVNTVSATAATSATVFTTTTTVSATGSTGFTGSTGDTETSTTTTVSATGSTGSTGDTETSTTTGNQINFKVPITKVNRAIKDYVLGSSSILSVKPVSQLNATGSGVSVGKATLSVQSSLQSVNINIPALADSISGKESQGISVQKVVNYYFTPGAPGSNLFKGITPSQFLTAALQIHPKLPNGVFDQKYVEYCNALSFPVTNDPEAAANKGKRK
jgi:hypothetical protein